MDTNGGHDEAQKPSNEAQHRPAVEPPAAPMASAAVERGVGRFVDQVVDQALARLGDKKERTLVRDSIAQVLREELTAIAEQEARAQSVGAMAVGQPAFGVQAIGDTAQAGIDVAKQVQNLGFVEFTAGLVNGTFDAITNATIRQMDAYTKMVADLAKTLAQFQAENVSNAQINAHLATRYPDETGGTVVRSNYTFQDTAENPASGTSGKLGPIKFVEVARALIAETSVLKPDKGGTPLAGSDCGLPNELDAPIPDGFSTRAFSDAQVIKVRKVIGQTLATNMIQHLREMAREGMARIVVKNGKIRTKLTFNVTTTEQDCSRTTKYHRDSAGAYVRGSAGWLFGRVSAGANWNQLNVNTVNSSTFDAITMSTEMIGEVELTFQTETFPPIEANQ